MDKIIVDEIELIKENCIGKLLEIFDEIKQEIQEVKEINESNILLLKINIEQGKLTKKCKICNRDFEKSLKLTCHKCFYIHKCKNCNKLFISNKQKSIMCSLICSVRFKAKPKYCKICDKITTRSANGICSICNAIKNTESKFCEICDKITKRNGFGKCVECVTKINLEPKYCEICDKVTKRNNFGICVECMVKERAESKFCEICDKITKRNSFGICVECMVKEKMKPKFCEICDKITKRDTVGKCIICAVKERVKPKYCKICDKITKRNIFNQCIICSPNVFNRDKFYSLKLQLISFESKNKIITLKDIDKYINIPGIWSICSKDENNQEICLDVCETQNIGKEMLGGLNLLETGKNNLNKTDEEIKKSRIDYKSDDSNKRIKYRNIAEYKKYGNIIFKLVSINIENKEQRWNIESQYAHDNKAKYWNPAPGQSIIFKQKLNIQLYKNINTKIVKILKSNFKYKLNIKMYKNSNIQILIKNKDISKIIPKEIDSLNTEVAITNK